MDREHVSSFYFLCPLCALPVIVLGEGTVEHGQTDTSHNRINFGQFDDMEPRNVDVHKFS